MHVSSFKSNQGGQSGKQQTIPDLAIPIGNVPDFPMQESLGRPGAPPYDLTTGTDQLDRLL